MRRQHQVAAALAVVGGVLAWIVLLIIMPPSQLNQAQVMVLSLGATILYIIIGGLSIALLVTWRKPRE